MMTEKKMVIFSLVALIVGVSSIIPVGYFLVTTAKGETFDEPWFSVNVPYSYWMAKNGTFEAYEYPEYVYVNETEVESYGHLVVINFTLISDIEKEDSDARVEYFRIELTSDKAVIENVYGFIGTNSDSSFRHEDFHFSRDGWFDTSDMGGGGLLKYNWTTGDSILWPCSGAGTGTIRDDSEVSKIREAKELILTVYRLGWVTFSGNSTIVTNTGNEIVVQIHLEKYGNGWLHNDLIPEEELPTIDLWRPLPFEDLMS